MLLTEFIGPTWYSSVVTKQKFVLKQEKYGQIYSSPIFNEFSSSKILFRNDKAGGKVRQNVWLPDWWY